MSKKLVAFFSASGVTEKVAKKLAAVTEAELFEIKPQVPYTNADLDWNNKNSRSSVEMNDPSSRPVVATKLENMENYDTVFLGFPIWWYVAPTIIHTFLESYDFSGKTVITFCTSGSSGMGKTDQILKGACAPSVHWIAGKRFSAGVSEESLSDWVKELKL
ncbi:flavodoxin [Lachnospiraceae bacterium KM106-2]|nr:flavodoxin [Lachnospiraceae bacterium KM106-2]